MAFSVEDVQSYILDILPLIYGVTVLGLISIGSLVTLDAFKVGVSAMDATK